MRIYTLIIFSLLIIWSCTPNRLLRKTKTLGDLENVSTFGYQPIDPLPVFLRFGNKKIDSAYYYSGKYEKVPNTNIMSSLPDETMRLAIGQFDTKGNVSFGSAKIGYKGSSYIVVIDYMKFDTKSFPVVIALDSLENIKDFRAIPQYILDDNGRNTVFNPGYLNPQGVIPVYVGVGLRFSATIKVNEGEVDLGNLFALGTAAESKKITGTLIIQTLGISGENISTLIPMPSQLNTTTIQNAIMALSSIKSNVYDSKTEINPRVVGFYNNLGGGQRTVNKFISNILSQPIEHLIR